MFNETNEGILRSFLQQNYLSYAIIRYTWYLGNMLHMIYKNFLELFMCYVLVKSFLNDFTFNGVNYAS